MSKTKTRKENRHREANAGVITVFGLTSAFEWEKDPVSARWEKVSELFSRNTFLFDEFLSVQGETQQA